MDSKFTSDFFKQNRKRLQQLFTGTAPIVLNASGLMQSSNDTTYPFKQDTNFWYLTGVNVADVILVIDKSNEYLILPEREEVQTLFDGTVEAEELRSVSGIETVFDHKTGWNKLKNRINKVKYVATIVAPPNFISAHGFYTNPVKSLVQKKLTNINQDLEFLDLRQHLCALRMIKQQVEIEALKQAIKITNKTIQQIVKKNLNKYLTEYDIETEIIYNFRNSGADGPAFDSIVAAGANACVIHHLPNRSILDTSAFMIIDIGAQYSNYAADISRTYALSEPTKRMVNVYDVVLDVQNFAISLLKPGVIIKQYEEEIERYMGEKLRELGLIKTIDSQSVRKYFPHATSHHLGLDAHDLADYSAVLASSMVLTVEPGIYIPEEGIAVRIEDDVIINKHGNDILSGSLPRKLLSPTINMN